MSVARWIFAIAGIYGLLVVTPHYFLEEQIGRDRSRAGPSFPPRLLADTGERRRTGLVLAQTRELKRGLRNQSRTGDGTQRRTKFGAGCFQGR